MEIEKALWILKDTISRKMKTEYTEALDTTIRHIEKLENRIIQLEETKIGKQK